MAPRPTLAEERLRIILQVATMSADKVRQIAEFLDMIK